MNTKMVVRLSLLIGLEIALTRFASINTPIMRIGFGFLPIAVAGMMYGPLAAGMTAAAGDVIGALLFPIGPYFPGFTLTSCLTGVVFGLCLHKRQPNIPSLLIGAGITNVVLGLGLTPIWLWMLYGYGFAAMIPARLLQCLVMFHIQVYIIGLVWRQLHLHLSKPASSEKIC